MWTYRSLCICVVNVCVCALTSRANASLFVRCLTLFALPSLRVEHINSRRQSLMYSFARRKKTLAKILYFFFAELRCSLFAVHWNQNWKIFDGSLFSVQLSHHFNLKLSGIAKKWCDTRYVAMAVTHRSEKFVVFRVARQVVSVRERCQRMDSVAIKTTLDFCRQHEQRA